MKIPLLFLAWFKTNRFLLKQILLRSDEQMMTVQ